MNSADPRHVWSRLTAASRQVVDGRDVAAPYGFATRLAALAMAQERKMVSLFERFALRAVGVACLLAVASVAVNYSAITKSNPADDEAVDYDAVAALLNA